MSKVIEFDVSPLAKAINTAFDAPRKVVVKFAILFAKALEKGGIEFNGDINDNRKAYAKAVRENPAMIEMVEADYFTKGSLKDMANKGANAAVAIFSRHMTSGNWASLTDEARNLNELSAEGLEVLKTGGKDGKAVKGYRENTGGRKPRQPVAQTEQHDLTDLTVALNAAKEFLAGDSEDLQAHKNVIQDILDAAKGIK